MAESLVHKDSIDLLVSAVIVAGLQGDRATITPASRAVVAHADDMGRLLWDALAEAAGDRAGEPVTAPPYEWQPVFELMGLSLCPEQLLQVERTRQHVLDDIGGFDSALLAQATRLLQMLGCAIEHGLREFPRDARDEYAGLEQLQPVWRRTSEISAVSFRGPVR